MEGEAGTEGDVGGRMWTWCAVDSHVVRGLGAEMEEERARLVVRWDLTGRGHAMQRMYWNKQPAELLSATEGQRKREAEERMDVWEIGRMKLLEWSKEEEESSGQFCLQQLLPQQKDEGGKIGLTTTNYRPWHGCWAKNLQRVQRNKETRRESVKERKSEGKREKKRN